MEAGSSRTLVKPHDHMASNPRTEYATIATPKPHNIICFHRKGKYLENNIKFHTYKKVLPPKCMFQILKLRN
jgi:hypothetical protein